MKVYQKLKAEIVDLTERIDEAVSFGAYAEKACGMEPAIAYVSSGTRPSAYGRERSKFAVGNFDISRFTQIKVS